jgi:hypothetical protein
MAGRGCYTGLIANGATDMTKPIPAQLTSAQAIGKFCLAGKAHITLVSLKTQARYTYKITGKDDGKVFFVSVLYGSDNESDYSYLGCIFPGEEGKPARFRWTKKSKLQPDDVRVKAFDFMWQRVEHGEQLPEQLQVWHEGKCCRCARLLTVPKSIASGIGPECAGKLGFVAEEVAKSYIDKLAQGELTL